jgi:hypothetical protein
MQSNATYVTSLFLTAPDTRGRANGSTCDDFLLGVIQNLVIKILSSKVCVKRQNVLQNEWYSDFSLCFVEST